VIINIDGTNVEIVNWPEFKKKLLTGVGFMLASEISKEVSRMKLVDTGQLRRWNSEVVGDEVIVWSDAPHAIYLEYGTFDYFKHFGVENFPDPGYPSIPKKKELSAKERKGMPVGMQPFAPVRRTLFNDSKMKVIIEKGAALASK